MKEYRAQVEAFSKENERMQRRLESAVAELTKIRSLYDALSTETNVLKTTLHKVNKQRQDTERELAELKKYSRKLESSLTTSSKTTLICEVSSLNSKLAALTAESEGRREEVERVSRELDTAKRENNQLKEALEVKAEEFGLVGDVKAQVLFELAEARREKEKADSIVMPLEADIALLQTQLNSSLTAVEELKLIRDSNNEELSRLEAALLQESVLRTEVQKELENALTEKTKLLRLLDELDRRCIALKNDISEEKARKLPLCDHSTSTDYEDPSPKLRQELTERDETIRTLTDSHKLEVLALKATISSLQASLTEAKSALLPEIVPLSPPIAPPSKPHLSPEGEGGEAGKKFEFPGESKGVGGRKGELPTDPARFRALIAEEKKRTEELMRRLKSKPG